MAITVSLSEWDAQRYSYFEAGLKIDLPESEPNNCGQTKWRRLV
jgi:hypothetical protein